MEVVIPVLVLALVVAAFVVPPLLRAPADELGSDRRRDLEATKEAKYREIHDAELDYRMGKLSESEWRALDRELRAQAIETLKQLDRLPPD